MARRSLFRRIELVRVLQQSLHPLGVRRQDLRDVGLRIVRLREPPNGVDGILGPDLAFVHPFDWGREFGRVVPEKLFGEPIPDPVAPIQQYPEIVKGTNRPPAFVRPTQIQHEAASRLEDSEGSLSKLAEPGHILGLRLVAVAFLPKKGKGRTGDDQIHRIRGQRSENDPAVRAELNAAPRLVYVQVASKLKRHGSLQLPGPQAQDKPPNGGQSSSP